MNRAIEAELRTIHRETQPGNFYIWLKGGGYITATSVDAIGVDEVVVAATHPTSRPGAPRALVRNRTVIDPSEISMVQRAVLIEDPVVTQKQVVTVGA